MERKLSANIQKELTKEIEKGVEGAEKAAENMTLEINPKVESKGLGKILDMVEKEVDKKLENIVNKNSGDSVINKIDKEIDALQKSYEKAGAIAKNVKRDIEDVLKTESLIKSNTGYRSQDKIVKTNSDGTKVTQWDVWEKDDQRIEKSRTLNKEQKAQLKELSKEQKQLNTLKENELATIKKANDEEKQSADNIIKKYNSLKKLEKIIEVMKENEKSISKIIGKEEEGYTPTSKTTIPKSIVPIDKDETITDYLNSYDLAKELKAAYKKAYDKKKAERDARIQNNEFKNTKKIDPKTLKNAKKSKVELEGQLSKLEQAIGNQTTNLEQEAMSAIERYLEMADKDTNKALSKLEDALKKVGTYIGSGGDLETISNEFENILSNNKNLGGETDKGKEMFLSNVNKLRETLKSEEDFKKITEEYYNATDFKSKVDIKPDNDLETLKKQLLKAKADKQDAENYIEEAKKLGAIINDNTTFESAGNAGNGNAGNEHNGEPIHVPVTPDVDPEQFVSEITDQLKGHSVKVDVELNTENIKSEVDKITELISDKKEIEVSVKQLDDKDDNKPNRDTGSNISEASVSSEVKKQNEIQKELQETDEQVQRLMFHYGNLNKSFGGKESHQFGDEITAYAEGKRNGNRGWADGTGTYVTNDATEFGYMQKDELKKFFAFDTSKLKMYEAHVEEEAQRFYEFQHKLEQFVLALGSGFTGFDDNISDVDSETLYKEAKSVFSKYPEIFNNVFKDFDEFDAFIDVMIELTATSGMNENGLEAKNAKKFMNFKKENGIDDIKTRFLKKLGFQGTDLSGTSYGGIQTGSVIFDIEEAPIIASGKTITEVLEQIGVTADETKYKVEQVGSGVESPVISQGNPSIENQNKIQKELQETQKEAEQTSEALAKVASGNIPNISNDTNIPITQYTETKPNNSQPALEGNKQYDTSEEVTGMINLKQEVEKVTNAVDEKTNAFREEEQVVTGTVQREIRELERLSGELFSIRQDIENIVSTIATLPKIDFDVDLSKLNVENIDGAAIASFNTFREQLAGLEAQLNVSSLSEKLLYISEAFEKLSKVDRLGGLDMKKLNVSPLISLAEKAAEIKSLTGALEKLGVCLKTLKDAPLEKAQFDGLKLTKTNVNNMVDMAVALETVGKSLQNFDNSVKESLSSINELLGKSDELKILSSIIQSSDKTEKIKELINEKKSDVENTGNGNTIIDIFPSDKEFNDILSKLDLAEEKISNIVKITRSGKLGEDGEFYEELNFKYKDGSSRKYSIDRETGEGTLTNYSIIERDDISLEKEMNAVQKQITKETEQQTKAQQKKWEAFRKEQEAYVTAKAEADAKERDAEAYKKLTAAIKEYGDTRKRIAKGEVLEGDIENANRLEDKISELQKQPILSAEHIKSSEDSLEKLLYEIEAIEKKTQAKANKNSIVTTSASDARKSESISDNIANGNYEKELKKVQDRYAALGETAEQAKHNTVELTTTLDNLKAANGVDEQIKALKEFRNVINAAKKELNDLEGQSKVTKFTTGLDNQMASINDEYGNIHYLKNALYELGKAIEDIKAKAGDAGSDLLALGKEAKQAFVAFNKKVLPQGDIIEVGSLEEAVKKAKSVVESFQKVKTELKSPMQVDSNGIARMTAQVVDLNGELKNLTFIYNSASGAMVKQTTNVRKELSGVASVVDAVKSKLKELAVYWTATMFDPYDIINGFRQVYDVVKELDDQFVEMQKVSDESISSLKEYQNLSFDKADEVGTTASQLMSSTADFLRIGETLDKAAESAKTANTLLNVSEFDSIDAATESLTAMSQAYSELDKMDIVNKLNLAGNNFSISTAGLAEALQKSAAALKTQGNDINEAIALVVSGNAVGQNPDSTGAGIRTISLRIAGKLIVPEHMVTYGAF